MSKGRCCFASGIALVIAVLCALLPSGQSVGVCYGMLGDNLPPSSEVINLYKSKNIDGMRLYDPNMDALNALRDTNIGLLLGVNDLEPLASDPANAVNWVRTNIQPFWPAVQFRYIIVGNELIPNKDGANSILPAMQNIDNALAEVGLKGPIKVTTAVDYGVMDKSYPPSEGVFSGAALNFLGPILNYLASNGAPLLVNIYPYFSYVGDQANIPLEYATFQAPGTVVHDGQFEYQNLFDAMLDAAYAALEKAGTPTLSIVVSESGWPSDGGVGATVDNARAYNQGFIGHINKGSPRTAGRPIEGYIFAMFNENKKPSPPTENNFGLFYPNQQPVYPINF